MSFDHKKIALRAFNRTKSCVLMYRYANGMWSLPEMLVVPKDTDPFRQAMFMVEHSLPSGNNIEVVSLINLVEYKFSMPAFPNETIWGFIYDIDYKGRIIPEDMVQSIRTAKGIQEIAWIPREMIKQKTELSTLTKVYTELYDKG